MQSLTNIPTTHAEIGLPLLTNGTLQIATNNNPHDEIMPYVRLGRAVIQEALEDLNRKIVKDKFRPSMRADAERFIFGPNECAYWCWVGEIDYNAVIDLACKIIDERDEEK